MRTERSSSSANLRCWCGCRELEVFGESHRQCSSCGTLVSTEMERAAIYAEVGDDESGFYGEQYWSTHVPVTQGFPTLKERARSDLTERAIDWMCRILELREPPADILELGCAHARLVMLLCRAGFDAEGLEMSPSVVRQARELSHVPVYLGPLDPNAVRPIYDIIAAMDVVEHLAQPVETLRNCHALLPDDGLLVLQTPCHRGEDDTWEMLIPEHLFLFSDDGVRRLLDRAGFAEITIGSAFFPYDMWVVASPRGPIPRRKDPYSGLDPLLTALIDGLTARNRIQRDLDWSEKVRRELEERLGVVESTAKATADDPSPPGMQGRPQKKEERCR